jgi:hypothetical protein
MTTIGYCKMRAAWWERALILCLVEIYLVRPLVFRHFDPN